MEATDFKKLTEIMTEYEKIEGFTTILEQYINDGGYILSFSLTSKTYRKVDFYPPACTNSILERALEEMLKVAKEETEKAKHYIESISIKIPTNE